MVIISERLLLCIVYSVMTWTVSRFCDYLPPAPTRICLLDCDSLSPALIFACIVNALYSPLRLFVCAALLFNKLHMDPQSTDSSLQKTSPTSDPAVVMQLSTELSAQANQLAIHQHQLTRLTSLTEELVNTLQNLCVAAPQPEPASARAAAPIHAPL